MAIIFKHGAMSKDQQHWVSTAIGQYPFAAFMSKHPDTSGLTEYEYRDEDDMGFKRNRRTQLWTSNHIAGGVMILLKTKEDWQKIVDQTEILIDAQPLQTMIL